MTTSPLELAADTLARTPRVLRTLLTNTDPVSANAEYAPGVFTPTDALAHMLETERTAWLPRMRHLLQHGESQPFPAVDRYAHFETAKGMTLDQLLAAFESARATNLAELGTLDLTDEHLAKRGHHPALGPATLSELIITWAAHDLNHTAQIVRGLAAPLADHTGPWRQYLGIYQQDAKPMDNEGIARRRAARS